MDGILIPQPIGSFDCVVHVPSPIVVLHVAESGVNTTLKRQFVLLVINDGRDRHELEQQRYDYGLETIC